MIYTLLAQEFPAEITNAPRIDHWMLSLSGAHPTTSRIPRSSGLRMRPFSRDPYLADSSHTRRSWSGLQSS